MRAVAVLATVVLAAFAAIGCGHGSAAPSSTQVVVGKDSAPEDPERKLYENMRSARYQISAALESVREAIGIAGPLSSKAGGDAGDALADVSNMLDDVGSSLAEHGDEMPPYEEYKKTFASMDEERLQAIDATSEALRTLADAQKVVTDLGANAPASYRNDLSHLSDSIDEASDALKEAIQDMGGKLPAAKKG